MNKGIIRGLDPNAFALNKPGGVSIMSSDLNAVPLTITGENGQSANLVNVTAYGGAAGGTFAVATVASPVNGITITNSATTVSPTIAATGTDAAVGLVIQTRNSSASVNALTITGAGAITLVANVTTSGSVTFTSADQGFFGNSAANLVNMNVGTAGTYFTDTAQHDMAIKGNTGTTVRIGAGGSNSSVIAASVSTLSFYGATPVSRAGAITQVVTTGSALASYGYTQAQADSIVTRINAIIVALQNIGITS